jgi:pSer/pThr/pTyr-binding forkhead associated (FHA) protein
MLNAKLVVVGGATEGDEFQLNLPATLGRARSASIPLPHPLVSRQHCELIERDEHLFVRDLGSTNGTFVGSERVVNEAIIEHGALLTIGTVTFRAHYEGLPVALIEDQAAAESSVCQIAVNETDTSTITRIDTHQLGTAKTPPPSHLTRLGHKAK